MAKLAARSRSETIYPGPHGSAKIRIFAKDPSKAPDACTNSKKNAFAY